VILGFVTDLGGAAHGVECVYEMIALEVERALTESGWGVPGVVGLYDHLLTPLRSGEFRTGGSTRGKREPCVFTERFLTLCCKTNTHTHKKKPALTQLGFLFRSIVTVDSRMMFSVFFFFYCI
jgi:hypothetical protein